MAESQTVDQDLVGDVASLLVEEAGGTPESAQEPQEGNDQGEAPEAQENPDRALPDIDLNPEVPQDILEEIDKAELDLDEPEDDDDFDVDLSPSGEWEDEETKRLKAKLRKLEKREKFLEEQNARTGRKVWAEEAAKYFPLAKASLDTIDAKSRKAFLREAKRIHEQVLPAFETVKQAHDRSLEAQREKIREELRAEFEEAWGRPTVVQDSGPQDHSDADRRMAFRTNQRESLVDKINARIKSRG